MGNKIDEFLRKNYHKEVPFEEKYWREAQALLDPPKKDRKLLWLLLLLCSLMSTYIIYDYFKDQNRIASSQNAKVSDKLIDRNNTNISLKEETTNSSITDEKHTDSKALKNIISHQELNHRDSRIDSKEHVSGTTNSTMSSPDISKNNSKISKAIQFSNKNENVVTSSNQPFVSTSDKSFSKVENFTRNNGQDLSTTHKAFVRNDRNDMINEEIMRNVLVSLEGIETLNLFIAISDELEIAHNVDAFEEDEEKPVIKTPLSPLVLGLTTGGQLNPYASGDEKSLIGAVAGLTIEKEFTHTLSVYSGLLYQMKRGTFTSVDQVSNFSTSGFERQTDEYFSTPESLHYLKIPLQMHKRFGKLSLGAGLSAAYLVGIYGNISAVTGINSETNSAGVPSELSKGFLENENLNKFNFDANIRAEYDFSNLSAYIQSNYLLSEYSNEFDQQFLLSESNPLNLELGIELKL